MTLLVDTAQWPLVRKVDFTYADLTAATAIPAIKLPVGAIVIGGELVVETAWDTAGGTPADTVKVGDGGDDDRYSSSAISLRTAARTALTLTGYTYTQGDTVDLKWAQNSDKTTDPTQGAGYLLVQFIIDGRDCEVL